MLSNMLNSKLNINTTINTTRNIVVSSLRSCYADYGILAGKHQFSYYWARDSFFASFGSLVLKDYDIVRKNLSLFLRFTKNGMVPLSIGDPTLKFFIKLVFNRHFFSQPKKLFPYYKNHHLYLRRTVPLDVGSLLIIIMREYFDRTRDIHFLRNNIKTLLKIIKYYERFVNDYGNYGLVIDQPSSTWDDSIIRHSPSIYTNILYYKALVDLNFLIQKLGLNDLRRESSILSDKALSNKAAMIKKSINTLLWNKNLGFYSDSLEFRNHFSTPGNLLAIIFGVADKTKALKIVEYIDDNKLNYPVPTRTNYPSFPSSKVYPLIKLVGLRGYHNNNLSWLWIGALELIARAKLGLDYKTLLSRIVFVINKYNGVFEIYDKKGRPFKNLFYRAEHPFAWSSGLLIYAFYNLGIKI